jgi:hypothetical protein
MIETTSKEMSVITLASVEMNYDDKPKKNIENKKKKNLKTKDLLRCFIEDILYRVSTLTCQTCPYTFRLNKQNFVKLSTMINNIDEDTQVRILG